MPRLAIFFSVTFHLISTARIQNQVPEPLETPLKIFNFKNLMFRSFYIRERNLRWLRRKFLLKHNKKTKFVKFNNFTKKK